MECGMAVSKICDEARQVVEIDRQVRGMIDLYLALFPNYERAASFIRVSKDTLAKYVAGNSNMALYVFRRMAEVVRLRYPEEEIRRRLEGASLKELAARARPSDLRQTDHVMCKIDASIRMLLDLHGESFRSRSRAARALGTNPRTFKAYFNGQIESFPCAKLLLLLEQLRERGYRDDDLLRKLNADRWDGVFQTRARARTLDLDSDALVEKIAVYFDAGDLRPQTIDRSLINLSKRLHGGFGATLKLVVTRLVKRQKQRVKLHLRDANADAAREEILRWEHYITIYSHKLKSINRALPREKKWPWREDIQRLVAEKESYKEELRRLDARILDLSEDDPAIGGSESPLRVKRYDPAMSYVEGDRIYHPMFGSGLVLGLEPEGRMRVAFKRGTGEVMLAVEKSQDRSVPARVSVRVAPSRASRRRSAAG